MTTLANAGPPKLPLWRTVGLSYRIWLRNFPELIRISWLWLVLMTPVLALASWLQAPVMIDALQAVSQGERPDPTIALVLRTLTTFVMLPMWSSLGVAWHRLVLRGERVRGYAYLRLDSIVVGYAAWLFLVAVLPDTRFLFPDPSQLYIGVGMFAGFIAAARVSLLLPAKALQREDLTIGQIWGVTRNSTWRLFFGNILCLLPMGIPGLAPALWVLAHEPSRVEVTVTWTIALLCTTLAFMVVTSFTSLAYHHFIESAQPAA